MKPKVGSPTLEILSYTGEGYKPLIDFGAWRVAFLRYLDDMYPPSAGSFERHMETDEVFVLLSGEGLLFVGGNDMQTIEAHRMEPEKLYNVRQGCWHGVVISRDATILLVENCDTTRENSEYIQLTAGQKAQIVAAARALADWKDI